MQTEVFKDMAMMHLPEVHYTHYTRTLGYEFSRMQLPAKKTQICKPSENKA